MRMQLAGSTSCDQHRKRPTGGFLCVSGWILNDDILLHIFSYLSVKEQILAERG